MARFLMLVGVPGCGKSTQAEALAKIDPYEIHSRDAVVMELGKEFRSYTEAFAKVDHRHVDRVFNDRYFAALADRKDIILDLTNLTAASRQRRMSQVSKDYTKYVMYFPISEDLMYERADARAAEGKIIPRKVLKEMFDSIQVPTVDEGFDQVFVKGQH